VHGQQAALHRAPASFPFLSPSSSTPCPPQGVQHPPQHPAQRSAAARCQGPCKHTPTTACGCSQQPGAQRHHPYNRSYWKGANKVTSLAISPKGSAWMLHKVCRAAELLATHPSSQTLGRIQVGVPARPCCCPCLPLLWMLCCCRPSAWSPNCCWSATAASLLAGSPQGVPSILCLRQLPHLGCDGLRPLQRHKSRQISQWRLINVPLCLQGLLLNHNRGCAPAVQAGWVALLDAASGEMHGLTAASGCYQHARTCKALWWWLLSAELMPPPAAAPTCRKR
jgi:hypothetical protein